MRIKYTLLALACLTISTIFAQKTSNNNATSFNDLQSEKAQTYFKEKIKGTQFIMLGEQHGIQEVGQLTNMLFSLAKNDGYNTLCVETSPFAAKILNTQFTTNQNPQRALAKIYQEYPFSIPFYNNKNDIELFENVAKNKGRIIGIDQVFMVEFRLVFDYLVNQNDNKRLAKAVKPLLEQAKAGFDKAVKEKNMSAPFIFRYTDELHNNLMKLTRNQKEKEILEGLKLTKEIYTYNFQKQYYKNNNVRAELMKKNFLQFYNKASLNEKLPKVLFKLGANHTGKGLNATNVFDISTLVSELAFMNNKKSLHIYAVGINGTRYLGNPFAPVSTVPFDSAKDLPKEVAEIINSQKGKYVIIGTHKLREKANRLSAKMKDLVLKYDLLIYMRDCVALEKFN